MVGKCCKVLATYKDHPLASRLVALQITSPKRGFGAAIEKLITAKNDFKHDRGPRTEEDMTAATRDAQKSLDECMKSLAFFTEFPIRQVVDYEVARTGAIRLKCLSLVGDHPGLRQEEVAYNKILPKRDLYIDAGEGIGWISLFPIMVAKNCPHCKTRETYFLDKWDRNRNIGFFKSYERGHEEKGSDIFEQMHGWLQASSQSTSTGE
jgi:hypothetical protein